MCAEYVMVIAATVATVAIGLRLRRRKPGEQGFGMPIQSGNKRALIITAPISMISISWRGTASSSEFVASRSMIR